MRNRIFCCLNKGKGNIVKTINGLTRSLEAIELSLWNNIASSMHMTDKSMAPTQVVRLRHSFVHKNNVGI